MRLKIATDSSDKIRGIRVAFSRFFQIEEIDIEVIHQKVSSGVPEQPFDEETYCGALNRVNAIINSEDVANFYISCEAGIEEFMGIYLNVQVVCIFDTNSQSYIFGKSAGWQIPSKDIEVIKESNLDNYLRNKGVSSIEEILGADYSRANAVAQATEFALASLNLVEKGC